MEDRRTKPVAAFLDQLERNAEIRAESDILDSRLNKLCAEYDYDPGLRRQALENGKTVVFIRLLHGKRMVIHRIHPEEFL